MLDDFDNEIRTVDALSNVTVHVYDDLNNEIETIDALGHSTKFTYDSRGNKLTETDSLSNTVTYTYNSFSQPLTITDARGNTTRYTYDDRGNLLLEQDALSNLTTYAYDDAGNMLRRTDALGNVTTNEYDSLGRVIATVVRDQASSVERQESFSYDSNGNRITQSQLWTSPTGVALLVSSNVFDAQNRLIATVHPDGSITRTEYNSIGKEAARVDALGRRTSYEYDDRGNLVLTTYPDDTTESTEYDEEGRKASSTDRLGRTTDYIYDALGRLSQTIYPDGATPSSIYDEVGRVETSIDALGNETHYEYEDCSCGQRQANVIDALGHVTHYEYDPNGNRTSMLDASGHTTHFTYDALNRQTVVTFEDSTTKITTYDALGRRVTETDQASLTTSFGYDGLGRLVAVTDALTHVTSYAYDEAGNMISQTDANGHVTRFEYDSMGRRVKRTLPEGQVETYGYDAAGNMSAKVDFNGKTTTFTYDEMNRLLTKQPDASFAASNIVFGYNAIGQRTNMADQSGATIYRYDDRDRLIEKANPVGNLQYAYDLQGSLTNLLILDQASSVEGQTSYTYDQLNRLHSVNDHRTGLTVYNYDNVGNLQDYIYPNGVSHAYQYDGLNRLTNMSLAHLTTAIAGYAYALNPAGHRTQVREMSGRTVNYSYDNLYRLTQETISGSIMAGQITYTYDAVGNRMSRNSTVTNILEKLYSYDMDDRLGSDSYDAAGNTLDALLRDPASSVERQASFSYDFENRILSVTSASSVVKILYDGDGNRIAKTVTDGFGSRTTAYLVDDRNPSGYAQVLAELGTWNLEPGTGALSRVYTYGLDLINEDQIHSSVTGDYWAVSFYGYDGHGNVRLLTDEGGNITDTYDYDAFGTLIEQKVWDPAFMSLVPVSPDNQELITDNHYLYTGEQFDPDLGLYFLRARYMETDRGRFWTMDTFEGLSGQPLSLHKYLYVNADPLNGVDPSGQIDARLVTVMVAVAIVGMWQLSLRAWDVVHGGYDPITGDEELENHFNSYADPALVSTLLSQAMASYNTGGQDAVEGALGRRRYIFDKRLGWIDLAHVAASAAVAQQFTVPGAVFLGFAQEVRQWLGGRLLLLSGGSVQRRAWRHSAFSDEDYNSNAIGRTFGSSGALPADLLLLSADKAKEELHVK